MCTGMPCRSARMSRTGVGPIVKVGGSTSGAGGAGGGGVDGVRVVGVRGNRVIRSISDPELERYEALPLKVARIVWRPEPGAVKVIAALWPRSSVTGSPIAAPFSVNVSVPSRGASLAVDGETVAVIVYASPGTTGFFELTSAVVVATCPVPPAGGALGSKTVNGA